MSTHDQAVDNEKEDQYMLDIDEWWYSDDTKRDCVVTLLNNVVIKNIADIIFDYLPPKLTLTHDLTSNKINMSVPISFSVQNWTVNFCSGQISRPLVMCTICTSKSRCEACNKCYFCIGETWCKHTETAICKFENSYKDKIGKLKVGTSVDANNGAISFVGFLNKKKASGATLVCSNLAINELNFVYPEWYIACNFDHGMQSELLKKRKYSSSA